MSQNSSGYSLRRRLSKLEIAHRRSEDNLPRESPRTKSGGRVRPRKQPSSSTEKEKNESHQVLSWVYEYAVKYKMNHATARKYDRA